MAWGDEEQDQNDSLTPFLVYGANRGEGTEAQPAVPPSSLPGPQPAQGNYSTGESATPKQPSTNANDHAMASNDDNFLKPPTAYNPPQRPGNLDQLQQRINTDSQQALQLGQPLNRADYKPSLGRRLAGGLFTGMMAFGHQPNAVQAGQDAIWAKYNHTEADRQTKLGAMNGQMGQDRSDYNTQDRDYQNSLQNYERGYNYQNLAYDRGIQAKDRQAQEQQRLQALAPGSEAPDDPQNPMGTWHAQTIGGKQIAMQQPPDSFLKTPRGVAAQRDADVTRLNLKGDDAKFYRANGKLREPNPGVTVRNEPAGTQEWNAYVKSLGRTPTTQDVLNYKRGQTGGGSGKMSDAQSRLIIQKKNDSFAKAQDNYKKAIGMAQTDDERQEAENNFLDAAEAAQQNYEQQIGQRTGQDVEPYDIRSHLQASFRGGSQPAPQAPQQPAAAPQQAAPAPKPAPAAPAQQKPAPPPTQARFNVAKWKAANPKGNADAAISAAKAKGYQIVGQ